MGNELMAVQHETVLLGDLGFICYVLSYILGMNLPIH